MREKMKNVKIEGKQQIKGGVNQKPHLMQANNGKGNNINRDDWRTPNNLWDQLNKQYNFNLDCCASKDNSKCYLWCDDFEKTYSLTDNDICWMNPPFSIAERMFRQFFKIVTKGVAIYRVDNIETNLWYKILISADWIHILKGRTNYEGHEGKGARFGSALIGTGVPPPKDIEGVTLHNKGE